ncbi:Lactonase, 7-bladed beta-propeller [Planctomycetes bacterium Poly30]|uniref:Lactonase, 7-bladed beta-propeller n=1 Tax=Saltatorellus ferox TaxID=2528018 RepID=A0A518EY81_9BACT|nr:Lactonase, 7-bladed beta-propeller [Planctomycetes bacterium Poly30]
MSRGTLLPMALTGVLSGALGTLGVAAQTSTSHSRPERAAVSAEGDVLAPQDRWFPAPRPATTQGRPILQQLTGNSSFETLNQNPEGDMPRDVAFTPDGQRVVVVNRDTDTVTVFDFATRAILATVQVGDFPVDVEVSPDGTLAAVPNVLGDTVSFIDLATYGVVATVPVTTVTGDGQPFKVQWDSASTFCLVAVIDGATTSRFSIISRATLTETASIPTSPQGAVGGFATPEAGIFGNLFSDFEMSADGSFVLVPDRAGDALNSYALPSGALLASVPVGDLPAHVDLSDDGTAAVVGLAGTIDAVVSLSVSGGVPTVLTTTPTNLSAFDPLVRITPDKTQAIVAVQNAVEFIDLAAATVVATVSTGTVGDIEFTFDDQFAVVTNFNTRVIRLSTRSQVASLNIAATYDAAVSPVSHRLVGLNNRFGEDLHYFTTNGSSSQALGRTLSGEEPEVDAPRRVTITPDGRRALVAANTSRSMAEFDLDTRTVSNVYGAGDRVWEIATDAAGTVAVVTSTGSDRVDVIDLVSGQTAATLSVSQRPTEVKVSADGTRAYVTTVAGTDRIHMIDLAGAASAVTGTVIAGQLGTIGYVGGQSSGIALSPDGNTLAVCVSFDDELLLVDTVAESVITRVPVGDFPIRCAWSPDGSQVFVTNTFGDSVSRIAFNGAASAVTGTLGGQDGAFEIEVDDAGAFVYVTNNTSAARELLVIDAATWTEATSLPLPDAPTFMDRAGSALFVTAGNDVHRVIAAGGSSAIADAVEITGTPTHLAFSASRGLVVTPQPGANDGLDLTAFGGVPTNECGPAIPNSTGASATIELRGTYLAGGLPLTLRASNLPLLSFGYFLHSNTPGFTANPAGSQGNLCLAGTIGRFNTLAMNSGLAGVIQIDVNTQNLPSVPTSVAIQPGDSWSFQLWYRDANPTVTSNFTDRVTVTFE